MQGVGLEEWQNVANTVFVPSLKNTSGGSNLKKRP